MLVKNPLLQIVLWAAAGISNCAMASAPIPNLAGVWKSDNHGFKYEVIQNGTSLIYLAYEDMHKENYITVPAGTQIGSGRITGNTVVSNNMYFNHATTVQQCGYKDVEYRLSEGLVSADATSVSGSLRVTRFRNGCDAYDVSEPVSSTRVTAQDLRCELPAPVSGGRMSKEKYVKHYKKYVKAVLNNGSGIVSPKQMIKRIGIGADIYEILDKQYDVLTAGRVAAMLDSPMASISALFLSNNPRSASIYRVREDLKGNASVLDEAAFCIGTSPANPDFFEMHLYAVEEASCNALKQGKLAYVRALQVNSVYDGVCSRDIAVGWNGLKKNGVNHVVMTVNARYFKP